MISIRFARPDDLPEILNVLTSALGDPHGRRNPEFWNWKHLENPFGPSQVMVAFVNGEMAGVRSMLAWEFLVQSTPIRAWRPVDTSTAPKFRRLGVFTKLTSAMVEHLSGLGPAVIFNTPNSTSKDGYIKMGWQAGVTPTTLVKVNFSQLMRNRFQEATANSFNRFSLPAEDYFENLKAPLNDLLLTNWTHDRLIWRYSMSSGLNYYSLTTENGSIIFRLIERKWLTELRILELFPKDPQLKQDVYNLIQSSKAEVVTVLCDGKGKLNTFLPPGFIRFSYLTPSLIYRTIGISGLDVYFQNENRRYFSGGMLELF